MLTAAVAFALAAGPVPQTADTVGVLAAVREARTALERLPELWEHSPAGIRWLFVTADAGFAAPGEGVAEALVRVELPPGSPRANMSYELNGTRFAMVVLPLRGAPEARVRLLVHEAMHTLQPQHLPNAGRTEAGDGGDLLDRAAGRGWLFLELRALARAMTQSGAEARDAARDALAFRAKRDEAASATERERNLVLDLTEGLPEYTGWRLSGATPARLAARLDSAAALPISWVRGVGYATGPAYGFTLDALGITDWRARVRRGESLTAILAGAVGAPDATRADARLTLYEGDKVLAAESARDISRERRVDSLRTRFVRAPSLRLFPRAMRVSFDPNGQTPLGTDGTVMRGFRWAADDGAELSAPDGALVNATWSAVQVPLGDLRVPEGVLRETLELSGAGWTLRLPAGWRMERSGNSIEARPPS